MQQPEVLIHMRVPAELKASWVRESRAAGMRLTDWIVERVERTMEIEMSMERTEALRVLASSPRKFEGFTAQQVIDSEWPGLKGLHPADIAFFHQYADRPCKEVAAACHDRARGRDPFAK